MPPATAVKPARPGNHTSEIRKLSTLLETSQALSGTLDLRAGLHKVLDILARHHSVVRSMVTLLSEDDGGLHVAASDGLDEPGHKIHYAVGEGITGKVVQSGRPVVVPRVSREPQFLRRASERPELARQELSFICVPIVLNRRAVGALGVDLHFKADRDYDRYAKFLGVVASMIAQALKVQRLVEAERRRLLDENTHLREELRERYDFSNIIGTSGPAREMYEQVARVASTNTTVLIRGESGTGKELIAHAIHYNSLRAKKPFVKVSCAALPESLIESELFGYEKGAFTGAQQRKKGRFELAEGGTLFLDEIGDLPLPLQPKLLRFLQERRYERVGEARSRSADVRLIAATNRDLDVAVAAGQFREDLLFRINVVELALPPLRERFDRLVLAGHLLAFFARQMGKRIEGFTDLAREALSRYPWPGNLRELRNAMERAAIFAAGPVLDAGDLPERVTAAGLGSGPEKPSAIAVGEPVTLEQLEAEHIRLILARAASREDAARVLGIDPSTLYRKRKQLGF
ncbi:MAG: sigma 54-interacting transcriptional regulator [Acidobacteriota bacterium]|nr:sigma 54-interacting transcriptional regulator [Acidobacteriota bacterium]